MVRSPCCDKLDVKKNVWTTDESTKTLASASKQGTGNWAATFKKAGLGRSCLKSCRLRWTNYMRHDLKRDNFTPQEEEMIVRLHAAIGSRWSIIAQQLPGRTENDVKNYWNTKLRKKLSEMGIDPVTHKPFSQILADYGNIGGLQKSGKRIGSLCRDLKSAVITKTEQYPSPAPKEGIADINNNWMATTLLPKLEPMQDCFLDANPSLDLLDQLQAIKFVTEASGGTRHRTISPYFLPELGSLSSSTLSASTSSSSCSTTAQEQSPSPFNWSDFLLEDAVCTTDPQDVMSQGSIHYEVPLSNNVGDEKMCLAIASTGLQESPSCHTSFVENILDQETETFLDFPNLLEEPFYT